MIVFDLKCRLGHVFEAWFGSTAAFESQRNQRMIGCPICDDRDIEKALMAPAVAAKSNHSSRDMTAKAELARLAAIQAELVAGCDYVGSAFATEARRRNKSRPPLPDTALRDRPGKAAAEPTAVAERGLCGEASAEEARALLEDGIGIIPLPFPLRRNADA